MPAMSVACCASEPRSCAKTSASSCICVARITASESPRGDLERVFDKGYSTKSKDTNYGIGLHWCANAIAALGGRIWAASEGPGLGASLHLMVPLMARET